MKAKEFFKLTKGKVILILITMSVLLMVPIFAISYSFSTDTLVQSASGYDIIIKNLEGQISNKTINTSVYIKIFLGLIVAYFIACSLPRFLNQYKKKSFLFKTIFFIIITGIIWIIGILSIILWQGGTERIQEIAFMIMLIYPSCILLLGWKDRSSWSKTGVIFVLTYVAILVLLTLYLLFYCHAPLCGLLYFFAAGWPILGFFSDYFHFGLLAVPFLWLLNSILLFFIGSFIAWIIKKVKNSKSTLEEK